MQTTSIFTSNANGSIHLLSIDESQELRQHEAVITRGLETFTEVGNALLAIRDKRLYRETHKTFEDYCQERWLMSRPRAYQFIDAANVMVNLSTNGGQIPTSERQARPLTLLEPEAQRLVWEVVQQTAPAGKVTADHVKSVVSVFKEVVQTGAIDDGSGIQVRVSDVVKAAVTEETYERLQRQQAYIHAKSEAKEQKRQQKNAIKNGLPENLPPVTERYELLTGNFSAIMPTLPAESFDAVITDPPYPREYLHLYAKLAEQSARVLKPGGSLLVMCGQSYLPEILVMMAQHLRYQWMTAYLTPGGQSAQLWDRKVNTFWKPVVWFVKGDYTGDWIGDVLKSAANDNDKRFHDWGQSESGMADIVNRFTYPGQKILDPFVGGGTTAVVCRDMNRLFTGIDIDPDAIKTTLARLGERQVT